MIFTNIDDAFWKPGSDKSKDPCVMHHYRQDLEELIQFESKGSGPVIYTFVIASTLMTLIDHITQIYIGEYSREKNRESFEASARALGDLDEDQAAALYQFRCALLHTGSLTGVAISGKFKGKRCLFSITDEPGASVFDIQIEPEKIQAKLFFWNLRSFFFDCIKSLRQIRDSQPDPKTAAIYGRICEAAVYRIVEGI